MTKILKFVGVAIVGIVIGYLVHGRSFGGVYNQVAQYFSQGLYAGSANQFAISSSGNVTTTGSVTVGSSGTAVTNQVVSTCSMIADNSISATSTGYAYCTGVTGVTSADTVLANFATSTLGFSFQKDGWVIVSAKASSTAAAIDFVLFNLTGKTQAPSASGQIGSTTAIRASH